MGLLSRDAILQANDLPREKVHVPEWGGYVFVRALTGRERDTFETESVRYQPKGQSEPNFDALQQTRARLCARAMCDEQGNRLLSDADVEALGTKSAAALDRVYEVAARLSGISAKDLEELEKNSVPRRADVSYFSSQGRLEEVCKTSL